MAYSYEFTIWLVAKDTVTKTTRKRLYSRTVSRLPSIPQIHAAVHFTGSEGLHLRVYDVVWHINEETVSISLGISPEGVMVNGAAEAKQWVAVLADHGFELMDEVVEE